MFQVGNQGAVNSYGDFCYPLDNTDVMKEMTTQDFNLKNANGETKFKVRCSKVRDLWYR